MPAKVEDRLALLPKMNKAKLFALWRQLFKEPPRKLRRDLLIRILVFRIQEQAYGGLSLETRKRIRELASKLNKNPEAQVSTAPAIKPGTRLFRDWRGQSHQVTVLENSYEYDGKRYSSLSKIARLITGTRWSGPLFFGLRTIQSKEPAGGRRR